MVSLQAYISLQSSPSFLSSPRKQRIVSAITGLSYLPKAPKLGTNRRIVFEELNISTIPARDASAINGARDENDEIIVKLYAILELVLDRIEMHKNIKEQRENWNSLLLNSVNLIILTAATMGGVSGLGENVLALKVSSILLFSTATGILLIVNKIQPSQLVEEQRNAVRLFKQLQNKIQTLISLRNTTHKDVEDAMEMVLAIDRAYPLPLLGAMLDKFPKTFKPATWWPKKKSTPHQNDGKSSSSFKKEGNNGWSLELEDELRDIVEVIKRKDVKDYERLGNKALMLNRVLAVLGPLLTGIAAVGSAFVGNGSPWGGLVAAAAGSLASVVNTVEHGGQVGMVFEMYRNCAGFFNLIEQTVESTLEEGDLEKRENGELFEMKMSLKLGRSMSELQDLADKSRRGEGSVNEFASKLF